MYVERKFANDIIKKYSRSELFFLSNSAPRIITVGRYYASSVWEAVRFKHGSNSRTVYANGVKRRFEFVSYRFETILKKVPQRVTRLVGITAPVRAELKSIPVFEWIQARLEFFLKESIAFSGSEIHGRPSADGQDNSSWTFSLDLGKSLQKVTNGTGMTVDATFVTPVKNVFWIVSGDIFEKSRWTVNDISPILRDRRLDCQTTYIGRRSEFWRHFEEIVAEQGNRQWSRSRYRPTVKQRYSSSFPAIWEIGCKSHATKRCNPRLRSCYRFWPILKSSTSTI